jgi:hypothetical protein
MGVFSGELLPSTMWDDDDDDDDALKGRSSTGGKFGVPSHMVYEEEDTPLKVVNHPFDSLTREQLLAQSFQDLRQYARQQLHIVGVNKMRGTKNDLVDRILQVRAS